MDCDLHPALPHLTSLLPYLNDYWRDQVTTRGMVDLISQSYPQNSPITARPDWRPENGKPGDSIVRARYRESLDRPKPLEPGRVEPITIRLYPTANVFKKGHRIRVDLSSSNYPRFDVNPNTGDPLGTHRRQR